MAGNKYYLDWGEYEDIWGLTEYIWSDVSTLIDQTVGEILGGDSTLFLDPLNPWESMDRKLRDKKIKDEKIKNLLEVIVSVRGDEKKFKKEVDISKKITISDIQKVINKYNRNNIHVKAEIKR